MRWLEVHRHWLTKIGGGSAGPVTGGEAEGARGELVLFHQGGGVRLQELRIRGPMKSGSIKLNVGERVFARMGGEG